LRVSAITKAEMGRSKSRTMVLAGTPAPTAPLMAYLIGLRATKPNFCSLRSVGLISTTKEVTGLKTAIKENDKATKDRINSLRMEIN